MHPRQDPNAAQTEVRLYRKEKTTGAGVWREVPGSQTGEQYGEEWEADGEWKKYEKLMECPEDGEYLLKYGLRIWLDTKVKPAQRHLR